MWIVVVECRFGAFQVPCQQIGDGHAVARVLGIEPQPGQHRAGLTQFIFVVLRDQCGGALDDVTCLRHIGFALAGALQQRNHFIVRRIDGGGSFQRANGFAGQPQTFFEHRRGVHAGQCALGLIE